MSSHFRTSRRRFVAGLATGVVGGLAGCAGVESLVGDDSPTPGDEWPGIEAHQAALAETVTPPDGQVTVALGFREQADVPFTTRVYEAPSGAAVQETERFDTMALSDVALVADPVTERRSAEVGGDRSFLVDLEPGSARRVTLVAQNETENAVPFQPEHPVDHPLGHHGTLDLDCYCTGETYEAPAGGTWARVIGLELAADADPGTVAAVNWAVGRV